LLDDTIHFLINNAKISSMLLVKNHVSPSKIQGLGLFADEHISKGTIIWKFEPGYDVVITPEKFKSLPKTTQDYLLIYTYINDGDYILCSDNGRYMNHSDTPNTIGVESEDGMGVTKALRDINPGEEITGDYSEFDDDMEYKKEKQSKTGKWIS